MRILSEHDLHDPETFLRGANAAIVKGLPSVRLYQRMTAADWTRAYFLWEVAGEHELREFIERDFPAAAVHRFTLRPIPFVEFPPLITSVFPFSIIRPNGGVIIQGEYFKAKPGEFLLLLSTSGTQLKLTDLQWGDTFAAGVIPAISGVPDQPAFLQIITDEGRVSNEWPVQFTAARAVVLLPGTALTPVACGSGGDDFCYIGSATDSFTVAGGHAMSFGFYSASGTDVYNCSLNNGWVFDHYQWGTQDGIQNGPFGAAPDPDGKAEFTLAPAGSSTSSVRPAMTSRCSRWARWAYPLRNALEDCAARIPSRFGFAEAARRRLSDKSDKLLGDRLRRSVAFGLRPSRRVYRAKPRATILSSHVGQSPTRS